MRLPLVLLALPLAGCGVFVDSPWHDASTRSAFGVVAEGTRRDGDAWLVVLDAQFVACERNATRWEGRVRLAENLTPGMRVGVQENVETNTIGYWPDLASYARACRPTHEADVQTAALRAEDPAPASARGAATAVRLRGAPVETGAATPLALGLTNRQDEPILVHAADLSVVNDQAYQASGWTGRVPETCRVEPRNASVQVPARGAARIAVVIHCAEDADGRAPYPECDRAAGDAPAAPAGCRLVTPHSGLASVIGRLAFQDELGNDHERVGILWQFLEVGRATRLHVEAPDVVRRPDDFVVRVRYEDADGRPLRNASVYASLLAPRITHHQFSLPLEGDAFVFRWGTMQEWRPRPWPEGPLDVVIEASDADGRHLPLTARATVRFA